MTWSLVTLQKKNGEKWENVVSVRFEEEGKSGSVDFSLTPQKKLIIG
jgi:hypothetical protein